MNDLQGVALVAGGTGGIGSAIVRLLVERGQRVLFTWRSHEQAASALAAETGAAAVQLDLTDAAAGHPHGRLRLGRTAGAARQQGERGCGHHRGNGALRRTRWVVLSP